MTPTVPPAPDGPRGRLLAAMLAGALFVPLVVVALAALAAALSSSPLAPPAFLRVLFTRALSPTGWIGLPMLGAGLAALALLAGVGGPAAGGSPWRAARVLLLAIALMVTGVLLVARTPVFPRAGGGGPPRGVQARMQAIRRATYKTPERLAGILAYTRDRDPVVRQQAALALGKNIVVDGIEGATPEHPSPFAALPVRDSLRDRLQWALVDPVEDVRAEAARALWKAPRTFGPQPAAAETLAAVLDRALLPGAVERLAWLALDAAAGAPEPGLRAAAARFAAATPDSELARAARRATINVAPGSSER